MKKILPPIILIIISVFLIFYRFTEIPKFLAPDEVDFARLAYSLENKPYAPYSQLATGHSTLYFYILLASLKTFGANIFALRFPAAIFGILCILIFYLILKIALEKHWLPFLLSMILLTSRWFLNFARFSFEPTFLLFLELMSIYFLLLGNAKITNFLRLGMSSDEVGKRTHWSQKNLVSSIYLVISGLFAGLAFLSYTPGRIFFLIPLLFLTLETLRTLKLYKLIYFLIPFIIIITPLTSYLLINKDSRVDQQFLLTNRELSINEKASGLWNNISLTTLMLFTKGDMNGRHNYPGKPALNPILGILFVTGIIMSIKNFKNSYNKMFLFYFLISLLPAVMTYSWENPNMLRTYTSLPSIIFFIGQGLIFLFKKNIQIIFLTLIAIICISSSYEMYTYFVYQPLSFKNSFNQPDYLPVIHKDAQNKQK